MGRMLNNPTILKRIWIAGLTDVSPLLGLTVDFAQARKNPPSNPAIYVSLCSGLSDGDPTVHAPW